MKYGYADCKRYNAVRTKYKTEKRHGGFVQLRIDAWRIRTAYLLLRRQLLYPDELKRRRVYSTVNAQFLQYAT